MKPEIRKNLLGGYEVKFDCPKCGDRLTSPLAEAGAVDQCPSCATKFRVPGSKHREAWERKKEAERQEKLKAKEEAAEQRRGEKEERRRQQELEKEREKRQLIERQEAEDARRSELQPSERPAVQGEIVEAAPPAGEVSETAECPFCAEVISARAKKCKHCGELIDPVLRAAEEGRRAASAPTIVNYVQGATATATAAAESSVSSGSGCAGCLTLIVLIVLIGACAGALGA